MSTYAVRYTAPLWGKRSGYLVPIPVASTSVTIRRDGVATPVYAGRTKTALSPPLATGVVPINVASGAVGVDVDGNLTVWTEPGGVLDAVVTVDESSVVVPLPTLAVDAAEPIPPAAVSEAMLAFGVATQAELDAGLATRAPSTGIAQSAVTNLVSDLAGKQATIPPGTYVPTTPNTILRGVYVKPASGDGIQYVAASGNDANDGLSMGDAKATIAAAKTALGAGGGQIHFVGTKAAPIGAWATNLSLIGRGKEASLLTVSNLTADVFDLTGVNNAVFKDFTINGVAQRTAGAFFKVGGLHHLFENIKVSSPFQGFNITGSDVELRNILFQDYNAAWVWDYAVACLGASTAVRMFGVTGSGATGTAGMNKAFIYLAGSTSSINMDSVITSTEAVIGLLIERGHWVYVDKCEFESGLTAPAVKIIGGSARLTDLHAVGLQGVLIDPTGTRVEGISITGGEIVKCAREGVKVVTGGFGVDNLKVQGVDIADVSQETNNTYSGILIGAGVGQFSILDNTVRSGSVNSNNGNVPKHCVEITAGASDIYKVERNYLESYGTSGISDGGTGRIKSISRNLDKTKGESNTGIDIVATCNPSQVATNVTIPGGANAAVHYRVDKGGWITKIGLYVGNASGNIDVSVGTGPPGRNGPTARVASSGSVACPGTGYQEIALTAPVRVNAGDWLGLACDNGTATFGRTNGFGVTSNLALGFQALQSASFPIPSVLNTNAVVQSLICLIGVP